MTPPNRCFKETKRIPRAAHPKTQMFDNTTLSRAPSLPNPLSSESCASDTSPSYILPATGPTLPLELIMLIIEEMSSVQQQLPCLLRISKCVKDSPIRLNARDRVEKMIYRRLFLTDKRSLRLLLDTTVSERFGFIAETFLGLSFWSEWTIRHQPNDLQEELIGELLRLCSAMTELQLYTNVSRRCAGTAGAVAMDRHGSRVS
ncbi:hypothetical protein B0H14DRAFT_2577094 [Mycena olivaceomarginata]|nr:hypothetical protein B0H14DRAFT_2577094 [Mycena olivaceomarginata]